MVEHYTNEKLFLHVLVHNFLVQDGKLNLEEFILAMHLCEMGQKGEPLPDPLPINLVPPSLRRTWQGQQNGSAAGTPGSVASQPGAAGDGGI